MKPQPLETHSKLLEVESRLTKFTYLSKEPLPGAADAVIFQQIKKSQSNSFLTKRSQQRINILTFTIGTIQWVSSPLKKWTDGGKIKIPLRMIVSFHKVLLLLKAWEDSPRKVLKHRPST